MYVDLKLGFGVSCIPTLFPPAPVPPYASPGQAAVEGVCKYASGDIKSTSCYDGE